MPAPVIAERLQWPYSMSPLVKKLAEIRPESAGIDPVDRVTYEPGQITQCDLWFPDTRVQVARTSATVFVPSPTDSGPISTRSPSGWFTEWSSGCVEGRVTDIKLLKRQMAGRVGHPLLRNRVLLVAADRRQHRVTPTAAS